MDLTLRPWRADDAADFFCYGCTPAVVRYMNPGFPRTLEDCVRVVEGFAQEDPDRQRCRALVVDGRAVGCLGAFLQGDGAAQVAYWLGESFWRRGIMSAALGRFLAELRADLKLTTLTAAPDPENTASRRTLEKAGFRLQEDGRTYILHWEN